MTQKTQKIIKYYITSNNKNLKNLHIKIVK